MAFRKLLFVGAVLHLFLTGCTETCPSGTIQSGNVCKRFEDVGGADGSGMTSSATSTGATSNPDQGSQQSTVRSSPASASGAPADAAQGGSSSSQMSPSMMTSNGGQAARAGAAAPGQSMAGGAAVSTATAGTAANAGTQAGTCTDGTSPTTEECNGKDDDCDAKVDEDIMPRPCGPAAIGACRPGTETCISGQWSDCVGSIEPTEEVCDANNQDEDCDNSVNEGCACNANESRECGSDEGECRKGKQSCTDGAWPEECPGETGPAREICNNKDDDCDGQIDVNVSDCTGTRNKCLTGRCVQCAQTSDCSGGTECRPMNCTASGDCESTSAPRNTKCNAGLGVCDGSGRCVGCLDDSNCLGGFMCGGSQTCVPKPTCPNGTIDLGETCDPDHPAWQQGPRGACSATCRIGDAVYQTCADTMKSCWSGASWFCGPHAMCSTQCLSNSECVTPGHPNARCQDLGGGALFCALPCSTKGSTAGCPAGTKCVQIGVEPNPISFICGIYNWDPVNGPS